MWNILVLAFKRMATASNLHNSTKTVCNIAFDLSFPARDSHSIDNIVNALTTHAKTRIRKADACEKSWSLNMDMLL